ncbi:MAG: PAS domain S-box protein, partial [Candidatus Bipolaricaulis sp.]|nr:PAS domain S-box protein [Candidatus Bipolaricaulis sp.]
MKARAALERRYTALLVLLLAAITLAVTFSTMALLYRTAVAQERALLTDMARSQARLIEVVASHEMAADRDPSSAMATALGQVIEAHARFDSVGRTGELVLARREGDRILFVVTHADATASEMPAEIPFDAKLAEPMQRALQGKSGTIIGLDYRGHTVLAAYEPVRVPNLGVVAKIDLSEVQAPFLRAGLIALGASLGAILLGAWAFTRLTRPLIRRMRETQQRYEDVVEAMGEGLAFQDAEGRLTYVNDRLCEMTGFRRRDVLGRRVDEFFHESQRDEYRRQMERRRAGEAQRYEATLKRRDGSPLHVLMAPRALRDKAGRYEGSFAVVSEITDLKRVEEQLRREKELAQSYFDIAGVILVVLDAEGRIELINRRGVEVLGYTSAEELVGREWFATCIPSAQRDEVGRVFRRIMAGDVAPVERFENAILRRDGQVRVVLWRNALLYDSEGRVRGTLSSGEDVTELRAQTARLAHVNAVLRAIRNVNQLITRETDRDRLLEEGCQELVATEGVRHAWAVEFDPTGRPLRAAEAGIGEPFDALRASLLRGELPTCCRRALSAGGPVVSLDPSTECGGCPAATASEDTAAIAVPLRREGQTHGGLVVTLPRAWAAD